LRSVLGDSLGSFRDGVLGKLSRQQETDRGLDLSRSQSGLLVVSGKSNGFIGKTIEGVVDERVHDTHGLLGNTSFCKYVIEIDGDP
jgi:hypothetical protein